MASNNPFSFLRESSEMLETTSSSGGRGAPQERADATFGMGSMASPTEAFEVEDDGGGWETQSRSTPKRPAAPVLSGIVYSRDEILQWRPTTTEIPNDMLILAYTATVDCLPPVAHSPKLLEEFEEALRKAKAAGPMTRGNWRFNSGRSQGRGRGRGRGRDLRSSWDAAGGSGEEESYRRHGGIAQSADNVNLGWRTRSDNRRATPAATPSTVAVGGPAPVQFQPCSWEYVDDMNRPQGPFPSASMHEWFVNGYLPKTLKVRREGEEQYRELASIAGEESPFVVSRTTAAPASPAPSRAPAPAPASAPAPAPAPTPTSAPATRPMPESVVEPKRQEEGIMVQKPAHRKAPTGSDQQPSQLVEAPGSEVKMSRGFAALMGLSEQGESPASSPAKSAPKATPVVSADAFPALSDQPGQQAAPAASKGWWRTSSSSVPTQAPASNAPWNTAGDEPIARPAEHCPGFSVPVWGSAPPAATEQPFQIPISQAPQQQMYQRHMQQLQHQHQQFLQRQQQLQAQQAQLQAQMQGQVIHAQAQQQFQVLQHQQQQLLAQQRQHQLKMQQLLQQQQQHQQQLGRAPGGSLPFNAQQQQQQQQHAQQQAAQLAAQQQAQQKQQQLLQQQQQLAQQQAQQRAQQQAQQQAQQRAQQQQAQQLAQQQQAQALAQQQQQAQAQARRLAQQKAQEEQARVAQEKARQAEKEAEEKKKAMIARQQQQQQQRQAEKERQRREAAQKSQGVPAHLQGAMREAQNYKAKVVSGSAPASTGPTTASGAPWISDKKPKKLTLEEIQREEQLQRDEEVKNRKARQKARAEADRQVGWSTGPMDPMQPSLAEILEQEAIERAIKKELRAKEAKKRAQEEQNAGLVWGSSSSGTMSLKEIQEMEKREAEERERQQKQRRLEESNAQQLLWAQQASGPVARAASPVAKSFREIQEEEARKKKEQASQSSRQGLTGSSSSLSTGWGVWGAPKAAPEPTPAPVSPPKPSASVREPAPVTPEKADEERSFWDFDDSPAPAKQVEEELVEAPRSPPATSTRSARRKRGKKKNQNQNLNQEQKQEQKQVVKEEVKKEVAKTKQEAKQPAAAPAATPSPSKKGKKKKKKMQKMDVTAFFSFDTKLDGRELEQPEI